MDLGINKIALRSSALTPKDDKNPTPISLKPNGIYFFLFSANPKICANTEGKHPNLDLLCIVRTSVLLVPPMYVGGWIVLIRVSVVVAAAACCCVAIEEEIKKGGNKVGRRSGDRTGKGQEIESPLPVCVQDAPEVLECMVKLVLFVFPRLCLCPMPD